MMRALWLHHPDDAAAVGHGDQFLWGRDILVSPVLDKGAATRRLYLPRGVWYDFWTDERLDGGREIDRPVDLATMPLHVRSGAILPMGPVRQFVEEHADGPLTISVYPGADGAFVLYEDDGRSFDYRKGAWMGIDMSWRERDRRLALRLSAGSRMLSTRPRLLEVRVIGSEKPPRRVAFGGKAVELAL